MKIRVRDVSEIPEEVEFEQDTSGLNPTLETGAAHDYECRQPAWVGLTRYRTGRDLFVDGEVRTTIAGRCARCLEEFELPVSAQVRYLITPRGNEVAGSAGEDAEVSVYDGEEVDLAPLIFERILLSLPTTPLCRDDCRGLCPRCGINLNETNCNCPSSEGDPRMAIFRTLRVDRMGR